MDHFWLMISQSKCKKHRYFSARKHFQVKKYRFFSIRLPRRFPGSSPGDSHANRLELPIQIIQQISQLSQGSPRRSSSSARGFPADFSEDFPAQPGIHPGEFLGKSPEQSDRKKTISLDWKCFLTEEYRYSLELLTEIRRRFPRDCSDRKKPILFHWVLMWIISGSCFLRASARNIDISRPESISK